MMKIRERKDGGFSLCSSPDEMVGKGRCIHVPDGQVASNSMDRISRGTYVSEVIDTPKTEEEDRKDLNLFFASLGNISNIKRDKIITILSNE